MATKVAVALALVVMGGFATAGAASADGPDTPPGVRAEIEALDWPVLNRGERRWEVIPAKLVLAHLGYLNVGSGTPSNHYDDAMDRAVTAFQQARDLSERQEVGDQTWEHLRIGFDEVGPGKAPALPTKAVQRALNEYGNELRLDGRWGPDTEAAVKRFQRQVGIDPDGWVGPITFRALICGGV